MLESLVNVYCDTYHPDFLDNLISSLTSYINSKLEYERATSEFITEVRRRLYLIHEYNCKVAKRIYMYPRSKKFDQLLIKYVELEFEVLYLNNEHPPKEVEVIAELRILRLLQVMLCNTICKSESPVNEDKDVVLQNVILELLGQVKSSYLTENKLIYNVINKLLKKVVSKNGEISYTAFDCRSIHSGHVTTSDYGTDDDSDFENDTFTTCSFKVETSLQPKSTSSHTPDCLEVPLMVNGITPIPTIEFTDDDDDNYMVYLQKRFSEKTVVSNSSKQPLISSGNSKKSNNYSSLNIEHNTRKSSKETRNVFDEAVNPTFEECKNEDSCILICSDSEEETFDSSDFSTKKIQSIEKINNNKRKEKRQARTQGVVTFEIMDDEDDENHTNYMVYLQKEVETNKRTKKRTCELINIDNDRTKEIIISDSEDDTVVEISEENNDQPTHIETNENAFEKLCIQNIENVGEKITYNNQEHIFPHSDKADDTFKFIESRVGDNGNIDEETIISKEVSAESFLSLIEDNHKENTSFPSVASKENLNITSFEDQIELNTCENSKAYFLVDPAIIFENISLTESSQTEEINLKYNVRSENQEIGRSLSAICVSDLETEKPNSPGGPVLSEKMDDIDDIDNLLECRLNDSLLEEILLNDSYLLDSQKEFEELECFLFNDKKDETLKFNIPNFAIESEDILDPEYVNKDIKKIESLTDIQTEVEENKKCPLNINKRVSDRKNMFKKKRRRRCVRVRVHQKKYNRSITECSPQKDFVNNNNDQLEDVHLYCALGLEKHQNYWSHKRENSFKVTCRSNINIVNKR